MSEEVIHAITIGQISDFNSLQLKEIPLPHVPTGYVLIQTEFAIVNVADELAVSNITKRPAHSTLGLEGSGVVVRSGGGQLADSFLNRRVAFLSRGPQATGSFSDLVITDAKYVLPLPDQISFEQGASLLNNPFTAAYLVKKIKDGNHRAVIQNAAASTVARCLFQYCTYLGIPVINLVKDNEEENLLRSLNAEYIINVSQQGWIDRAKELARSIKATIAFDSVGGDFTGELLEILDEPGILYVFGALSLQPCRIKPSALLGQKKTVLGLDIEKWLAKTTTLKKTKLLQKVQGLIGNVINVDYTDTVGLDRVKDALCQYREKKTANKFLIRTRNH
ncbi:unnamed protein product [Blepharisma stoltei]|uniref:Enoyl reductase (ER) domain-containing protein n=1 Tax=Blepharisma stoltei TaxID=1481888 RepID=A0AAU9JD69_9CILI|nr:unnamed protein product [Blepharisma stoltei]